MTAAPPRLAERLVRATARDPDWADAIAGDLHEEFAAQAAASGVGAARRWYWRQALGIAAHRIVRRTGRLPRHRAEIEPSTGRWQVDLVHDVRSAWRAVAQQPGVSATIVLVLALGLAANATMFALGDALVLRPFRFGGVDRAVALTVALLTAAGLTVQAVERITHGPLGFDPEAVLTARLALPESRYASPERKIAFVRDVLARLRGLPSVNAAAALNLVPYSGSNASSSFWPEEVDTTSEHAREVNVRCVTPEWGNVMRVPLVRGRALSEADRADAPPAALVSESLAHTFFPGREAIGRRVRLARWGRSSRSSASSATWRRTGSCTGKRRPCTCRWSSRRRATWR